MGSAKFSQIEITDKLRQIGFILTYTSNSSSSSRYSIRDSDKTLYFYKVPRKNTLFK